MMKLYSESLYNCYVMCGVAVHGEMGSMLVINYSLYILGTFLNAPSFIPDFLLFLSAYYLFLLPSHQFAPSEPHEQSQRMCLVFLKQNDNATSAFSSVSLYLFQIVQASADCHTAAAADLFAGWTAHCLPEDDTFKRYFPFSFATIISFHKPFDYRKCWWPSPEPSYLVSIYFLWGKPSAADIQSHYFGSTICCLHLWPGPHISQCMTSAV